MMIDFNVQKSKKSNVKQTKVTSSSCGLIKRRRVALSEDNKNFLKSLGFQL